MLKIYRVEHDSKTWICCSIFHFYEHAARTNWRCKEQTLKRRIEENRERFPCSTNRSAVTDRCTGPDSHFESYSNKFRRFFFTFLFSFFLLSSTLCSVCLYLNLKCTYLCTNDYVYFFFNLNNFLVRLHRMLCNSYFHVSCMFFGYLLACSLALSMPSPVLFLSLTNRRKNRTVSNT